MPLKIIHDVSKLSVEELEQYKRDVSTFIGLDPNLDALDVIWMQNESGAGQSLVLYARRGTAEILREINKICVSSLTQEMVNGSIVFTATGTNSEGRQEIATGSKFIENLSGKSLDDAIMTASTRALRRLTLQFTKLGLLDESEIKTSVINPLNPAGSAQLAANPIPPVFSIPTVPPNNAPGSVVEKTYEPAGYAISDPPIVAVRPPVSVGEPFLGRPEQIAAAWEQVKTAEKPASSPITPVESATLQELEAEKPAKKPRKKPNTVALDVEPEVVQSDKKMIAPSQNPKTQAQITAVLAVAKMQEAAAVPVQVDVAVPQQVYDLPSKEQMDEYRKKISVYTQQLPASPDMGTVPKMRGFLTKYNGAPPQQMTVSQYEASIKFLEDFTAMNGIKGLIKYINDMLGVK